EQVTQQTSSECQHSTENSERLVESLACEPYGITYKKSQGDSHVSDLYVSCYSDDSPKHGTYHCSPDASEKREGHVLLQAEPFTVLVELTVIQKGSRDMGLGARSAEHTSELQSRENLVCRLLL